MAKSIAVAGKGGTGKSTIAALLVLHLCEKGMGPVLAVDADPDSNLGTLLGVETAKSIGDLREEVLKEMKNFPAGMSKASYVEAGLHQIIEEASGFDLITMGRGEGSGCYCSLNNMIRKFSQDLYPSYSWVVIDNEAGLEHISRRTTQYIDSLIVVVNDNPLSFDCAERIENLTEDLKSRIKKKFLVTNMVRDGRKDEVHRRLSGLKSEHICDIPYDAELEEIVYEDKPLTSLSDSPTPGYIDLIIEKIGGINGNS